MSQSTISLAAAAPANGLTIAVFVAVLAFALGITFWAARRIKSATDFWSAGRRHNQRRKTESPLRVSSCRPRPSWASSG